MGAIERVDGIGIGADDTRHAVGGVVVKVAKRALKRNG
jgi:hypothetical protein